MPKEVLVYTTPTCPYCHKIKEWLVQHKVNFKEINLAEDYDAAQKMIEESNQAGVPVVKISENNKVKKIIIGYDTDALEDEFA
jgi:glutaredoxin 3